MHTDAPAYTQTYMHTYTPKMYHTYQVKYSFQGLEDGSVDQDVLAV